MTAGAMTVEVLSGDGDVSMGRWGRYQAGQLALALLPVVVTAMSQGNFVFAAAHTNYRCIVTECESPTSPAPVDLPSWWPSVGGDGRCRRPRMVATPDVTVQVTSPVTPQVPLLATPFTTPQTTPLATPPLATEFTLPLAAPLTAPLAAPLAAPDGNCSSNMFANDTEPCTAWIYEDDYSIVSEFELACEEWKRALVGTMHNVGVLLGMPLMGYISDRWGRRVSLAASATGAALGLLKPVMSLPALRLRPAARYQLYLALETLEAAVATGTYTTAFVFMLELLGDDKRIASSVAMGLCIAVGDLLLALVAWRLPRWTHLQLALYAPAPLFLAYTRLMDDSLRWLQTTGRTQQARLLADKIERCNRLESKELKEFEQNTQQNRSQVTEQFSLKLLFSSKILLKRVAVCSWWWFTTAFVYYGLAINSVSLPGTRARSYALAALASVPGELGAAWALRAVGRRYTLGGGLLASGVCCLATGLLSKEAQATQMVLYLLGKAFITLCFNAVYTYTAELLPTCARASLVGACSTVARLGCVLAPLTPLLSAWWVGLPTVTFGCAALCGAALALLLPETRGRALPDTVAHAEHMQ